MIVLDVQVSDEMAMQNVGRGCAKVEKIRIGLLVGGGRVKTPNINNKKLVVRSCVDVQRVFVFLRKGAL